MLVLAEKIALSIIDKLYIDVCFFKQEIGIWYERKNIEIFLEVGKKIE